MGPEFAFDMPLSVRPLTYAAPVQPLFLALRGWDRAPWRWLLQVACIALPVGLQHSSYQHYAVRVGWANLKRRSCCW